jgi:DNA repair protein RecO
MPEKTKAIVLALAPYRESSVLLRLFSERFGLLHGIAKGVRQKKKGAAPVVLERGFLVELFAYLKPHRDLHLLTGITVLDFFPSIRLDLQKSAMRDAAFETVLKGVTDSLAHPELCAFFLDFLSSLDRAPARGCFPFALWDFLLRFSALMGYGVNTECCVRCKRRLVPEENGFLVAEAGGVACGSCGGPRDRDTMVPGLVWCRAAGEKTGGKSIPVGGTEARRITRVLTDYCRYHFQARAVLKSIAFMDDLLGPEREFMLEG